MEVARDKAREAIRRHETEIKRLEVIILGSPTIEARVKLIIERVRLADALCDLSEEELKAL